MQFKQTRICSTQVFYSPDLDAVFDSYDTSIQLDLIGQMLMDSLSKETSQRLDSALQIIERYPSSNLILPNTLRFLRIIQHRDYVEDALPNSWAKLVANFKKRVYAPHSFDGQVLSSLAPPTPSFEFNKASVNMSTDFAEKATGQLDNECLSKMLEHEEQKFYQVSDLAESSIDFIYEVRESSKQEEDSEMMDECNEADVRTESQIEFEHKALINKEIMRMRANIAPSSIRYSCP